MEVIVLTNTMERSLCSLSACCQPEVVISEQLSDRSFSVLLLCGSHLWACVHGEAVSTLRLRPELLIFM